MSIDAFRSLTDAEWLRGRGLFVAEGRIVVRRVIEDPRYVVQSLLLNDAARRDLADVIEQLPSATTVHVHDAAELESIAGYHVHRGCLALVKRPPPLPLSELLATDRTLVILEGVTDPDNVGGVFRNAAAFEAGAVLLSPATCDPLYRKAVRTSMAAVLRVPFARADRWPATLDQVRAAGFTLVALTPREPSIALDRFAADRSRARKLALMLGTEGAGVSPDALAIADVRVRIPMSAAIDSLNVSVASGLALYALR